MTQLDEIRAVALRHAKTNASAEPSSIPRLQPFSLSEPTGLMSLVYKPVVCLVVQGAKRTIIGDTMLEYAAGECLTVATEVPALGQVSRASPSEPYLAVNLELSPVILSSLLLEMAGLAEPATAHGFGVMRASNALLDAWLRLVRLLDCPDEIRVLAPRAEDELLFRLLVGPQGALLRQIARADSSLSHIRRAMEWIRERFTEQLSIDDMAGVAGMSGTTFHRRFKALTAMSPLQYQKQLRLYEGRRRLIAGEGEANSVAFALGYESASQFSREYKRLFGRPPLQDARQMRGACFSPPR